MNPEFRCPVFGWSFFVNFVPDFVIIKITVKTNRTGFKTYEWRGSGIFRRQNGKTIKVSKWSTNQSDQSFKMIESKAIKVTKWTNQKRSKFQNDRIKSDQSYPCDRIKSDQIYKMFESKAIRSTKRSNQINQSYQVIELKAIKVTKWPNSKHFKWVASNWDIITPLDCFCVHHLLTVQQAQPSQLTLYFNQVKRMFISTSCKQDKLTALLKMKICLPLLFTSVHTA